MRLHHRITAAVSTAALALGAGLVAAAPATADTASTPTATATFTGVSISGLKKKIALPKSGSKDFKFTVNVSGTASDGGSTDVNGDGLAIEYKYHDADYAGPKVVKVKSLVKQPAAPRVLYPTTVLTGANTYAIQVQYYTSPGTYEVQVPVTQNNWTTSPRTSVTKVAKLRFQVIANKTYTKARTSAYAPSWKVGQTAKVSVSAPAYVKGAKATLYYKKDGAKKYAKIASTKLKVKGTSTIAKGTIKTKKLTKSGKVYIKVSAVKWSKAYKTKTAKITVGKR